MPYQGKRGRLSQEERKEYRRRHEEYERHHPDYLAGFHLPKPATVESAWKLLESYFCPEIRALEEPDRAVLIILLEHAIKAGEHGARLTFTGAFDVVCRHYSDHHRLCPAASVYDMTPETVGACWKDLQNEQVHLEKVFDIVLRKWPRKRNQKNPLFRGKLMRDGKETAWKVLLQGDGIMPHLRDEFSSILRDGGYAGREKGHHLLFTKPEESKANHVPIRKLCCDTLAYDVSPTGPRSEIILSMQENAELRFDAKAFNSDYQMVEGKLKELQQNVTSQCNCEPPLIGLSTKERKISGSDRGTRSLRDEHLLIRAIEWALNLKPPPAASSGLQLQDDEKWIANRVDYLRLWLKDHRSDVPLNKITRENIIQAAIASRGWRAALQGLLQQYDEYHRLWRDFGSIQRQVRGRDGLIPIYNRFYRVLNGRYQARYFWPSFVGPKAENHENPDVWKPFRSNWFKAPPADETRNYEELIGLDISSSQTQIMAVFLSIEELEMVSSSNSFKGVMAQIAWDRHYDPGDEFKLSMLPPGRDPGGIPNYEGPQDRRLQQLCKTLWMQLCYGSNASTVQGQQEAHMKNYGRGWTAKHASRFAKELFKKYPDVKMYLEACRKVAARAHRKSRSDGVRVTDPLDQKTLQWNPILLEIKRCRHGSNDEVRIHLPPAYRPGRDRYPVDKDELARRIAPCLIHLLDAFYSSLVMQRLWRSGVRNFLAIHDCWLVPERVKRGRKIQSGEEVLSRALQSAAVEWYRGLDCVYRSLRYYLDGDKVYGPWIRRIHRKWKTRVKSRYTPVFHWKKEA